MLPLLRRRRQRPVPLPELDYEPDVVGLRKLTGEEPPAEPADFVPVKIGHLLPHEGRRRFLRGAETETDQRLEQLAGITPVGHRGIIHG